MESFLASHWFWLFHLGKKASPEYFPKATRDILAPLTKNSIKKGNPGNPQQLCARRSGAISHHDLLAATCRYCAKRNRRKGMHGNYCSGKCFTLAAAAARCLLQYTRENCWGSYSFQKARMVWPDNFMADLGLAFVFSLSFPLFFHFLSLA